MDGGLADAKPSHSASDACECGVGVVRASAATQYFPADELSKLQTPSRRARGEYIYINYIYGGLVRSPSQRVALSRTRVKVGWVRGGWCARARPPDTPQLVMSCRSYMPPCAERGASIYSKINGELVRSPSQRVVSYACDGGVGGARARPPDTISS
jgi:hypothetical protein